MKLALKRLEVLVEVKSREVLGKMSVGVLTPWSRVLIEKLTGSQLVKKFPAFYGT